ncbi:MAG: hypothetical protein LBH84_08045 [Prevotellaceae bacterium]|jgi:hypothetical protein|nr:hypothetical protein [Prevotellaceae bacterium]
MKKVITILPIMAMLMSLSSCAIMFNGSKKKVNIITQNPGSEIFVDGQRVGTETASVKLQRKRDHLIVVKKDGCKSATVPLDREFQMGWVFLYLFVNPFAVITDAPSGAWYGFDQNQVLVPELSCEK